MNVDVHNLKIDYLNKVNDLYNQDVFLLSTCYKFPSKYSLEQSILDTSLRIFFEENNFIILGGKCLKYCEKTSNRKIKLLSITDSPESPDIIINNYVVQDQWKQIDW